MTPPPVHAARSKWCSPSGRAVIVWLALAFTVIVSMLMFHDLWVIATENAAAGNWPGVFQQALFATIIFSLIYGNLIYQITRFGCFQRHRRHQPVPLEELRRLHLAATPSLTVLVPSYKEEDDVVLQTLLSAALLEYPAKQIVLLIDDPPNSLSASDRENLRRMRALPGRVRQLLSFPENLFRRELHDFLGRQSTAHSTVSDESTRLATLFDLAAEHLERIGELIAGSDHVSKFFRERIIRAPARELRNTALQWREAAVATVPFDRLAVMLERDYRRLISHFSAEVISFERKLFQNLSHAPNKAMNLNAYLDLMGRHVREVSKPDGTRQLLPSSPEYATRHFDDADYIVTLDADSLLLNDYALRLVEFLERPENARVAIAQTPYSAFPDAPGTLERIAGITTDIQHIVHQGFTQYGSTYWVGANALIRKAALSDIVTMECEGQKTVRKFVQDRTVIEDTESSVDLWLKGWSLYNYPAQLAYSATPPDFGSLLIQRRRWANGGLIILPKLLRYIFQRPLSPTRLGQGLVQIHYLISLAASCFGVPILLLFPFVLFPFEQSARTWFLPFTAVPYFVFYGLDIRALGHRWSDLLRVYALNVALIPVHLGGVLASIRQAITGWKAPFGRTPKVCARTSMPGIYVVSIFGLSLYCIVSAFFDAAAAHWAHAAFALINGLFLTYAAVVFVGLRPAAEDVGASLRRIWRTRQKYPKRVPLPAAATDSERTSATVTATRARLAYSHSHRDGSNAEVASIPH